jgi:hypothetical protein
MNEEVAIEIKIYGNVQKMRRAGENRWRERKIIYGLFNYAYQHLRLQGPMVRILSNNEFKMI